MNDPLFSLKGVKSDRHMRGYEYSSAGGNVVKASKTCKNCADLQTHKAIRTGGDLYQLCQFAVI